ncbi:MAG: hypothetical protein MJZ66_06735 [Bacteroidales bacterium]|nr:hypothetical protein [Bacteroidales bacterium]
MRKILLMLMIAACARMASAQHLYDFDNALEKWERNIIEERLNTFSENVGADGVVIIYNDPSINMETDCFRIFRKYNLGKGADTNIVYMSLNASNGRYVFGSYGADGIENIINTYDQCLLNCIGIADNGNKCSPIKGYFDAFEQLYLQRPTGEDGMGFYQNNIRALRPSKFDDEVYDLSGFASYNTKDCLDDYEYYRDQNRNRVFYRTVLMAYPCHLSSDQIADTLALMIKGQESQCVDFVYWNTMQKSHVMVGINIFDFEVGVIHGGLIQDFPPSSKIVQKLGESIRNWDWDNAMRQFRADYDNELTPNQAYQDLKNANVSSSDDVSMPILVAIILVVFVDGLVLMLLTLVLTVVFGVGSAIKETVKDNKQNQEPVLDAGTSPRGKAAAMASSISVSISKDMSYLKDKRTKVQQA